jgi:hypothetical protein
MFTWLKRFAREHELPEDPKKPVRVDFIGKVVSPNVVKSPVSAFASSLIEIVLFDRELRRREEVVVARYDPERDVFTALGGVLIGSLIVEDGKGRMLHIDEEAEPTVVPLPNNDPIALDSPLTGELAKAAQSSQHFLTYRETRFREADRVRVRATVEMRERVVAGGYRGAVERRLVPVRGEELVLHEML